MDILSQLKNADLSFYRPVPFWSINSLLSDDEIKRQIGEMKNFGLGGFIFHARTGLKTPYLSEEWFHSVSVAIQTAKSENMKVWLYDEYGWPSGFIGGELLADERDRARFLRFSRENTFDPSAYAVYVKENDGYKRVTKETDSEEYFVIRLIVSDAYTDILNPAVTDKFIAGVYEKYYRRFSEDFGKTVLGFFTDEPQYYRYETPITAVAEDEFCKTYGEDLKDGLIYLFTDEKEGYPFRVKYYNLLSRLYCENYYRKLRDWCNAHGCMLTGHSVEETFFFTQMWGGADCAATYLNEDIPAIDNLAKNGTAIISAKSVGSVAAQAGKKHVMTETFGCSGYSVTPEELKLIADKQYVSGVNLTCEHLYNYTLSGLGKIDCPPSFGRALPWAEDYSRFNDYLAKLGYLIAESDEFADVAVITPMESVYLYYKRLDESAARENVDLPFVKTLAKLKKLGVTYHFLNEKVAAELGSVSDGKLVVGNRTYKQVVVGGGVSEIKSSTFTLLKNFVASGGELFSEKSAFPEFVDGEVSNERLNCRTDFDNLVKPLKISFDGDVDYTYRKIGGEKFLFVVNEGKNPVQITTDEVFSPLNLLSGTYGGGAKVNVVPRESSLILALGEYGSRAEFKPIKIVVPSVKRVGLNALTVDRVNVVTSDGTVVSGYFHGVFEKLVKRGYKGEISVSFKFESDGNYKGELVVEKQKNYDVLFNGKTLNFTEFKLDAGFNVAEIEISQGENEFSYKFDFSDCARLAKVLYDPTVPESLRNCVAYESGVEQIYVLGDFDVDESERIVGRKEKSAGDLTSQGLRNFCGVVEYEFSYIFDGSAVKFKPEGDFAACDFIIDGVKYSAFATDSAEISGIVGEKSVVVRCYSTMRNLLGPFYYDGDEDSGISNDCFTLRGTWNENTEFSGVKKTIKFGLNDVVILN